MKLIKFAPIYLLFYVVEASASSEPIECYKIAWEHPKNGGFGLTAGQAVELCSGTKDYKETLQCFATAWNHKDNGGLGLTAGQAVRLCKSNSESS